MKQNFKREFNYCYHEVILFFQPSHMPIDVYAFAKISTHLKNELKKIHSKLFFQKLFFILFYFIIDNFEICCFDKYFLFSSHKQNTFILISWCFSQI